MFIKEGWDGRDGGGMKRKSDDDKEAGKYVVLVILIFLNVEEGINAIY